MIIEMISYGKSTLQEISASPLRFKLPVNFLGVEVPGVSFKCLVIDKVLSKKLVLHLCLSLVMH